MEVKVSASPLSEKEECEPSKWEIEGWARTIIEAEEIKGDSEKMKLVQPFLDKKVKAIRSIDDLRKLANKKAD